MPIAAHDLRDDAYPALRELLTSGGDSRLACDPVSGFNMYGCRPHPRDHVDDFSSSTGSSISHHAFDRIERLWRSSHNRLHAFDDLIEEARGELRNCLGMSQDEAALV